MRVSVGEERVKLSQALVKTQGHKTAVGGLVFDWLMMLLGLLFLGGLYLDGWAHNHGKVDDSFFTVWHAFFYSGFALVALLLLGALAVNRMKGLPWPYALPTGVSTFAVRRLDLCGRRRRRSDLA